MRSVQKIKLSASALTLGFSLFAAPAHADDAPPPAVTPPYNFNYIGKDDVADEGRSNTVYTDYFTRGGNGSGGGAGLGGVFFVDTGANLTLNNVQFINNVVKGGDGGAPNRSTIEDLTLGFRNISLAADPVSAANIALDLDFIGGNLVIKGATLAASNELIGKGTAINFVGITNGGIIRDITDTYIALNENIVVDSSAITDVVVPVLSGSSTVTIDPAINAFSATQLRLGMTIYGDGVAAGTRIANISYDNNGKVNSITFDKATTGDVTNFQVVAVDMLEANRFSQKGEDLQDLAADEIRFVGNNPGLSVGMILSGEGIAAGTRVESINGNIVKLSQDVALGDRFDAAIIGAQAASNVITLPSGRSDLVEGMKVTGTGIHPDATIVAINGNQIILSHALCEDAASAAACASSVTTAITNNQLSFTFNSVISTTGSSVKLASVAGLRKNDLLTGNGIPANAVITDIDPATNTVTYRIDPDAAALLKGGSMNGIASGTSPANGGKGPNGSQFNPYLGDGEGQPGMIGGSGSAGDGAAGSNGGNGGNGSDAIPFNTEATLGVISATMGAAVATAEFTASLTTVPFPLISLSGAKAVEIGLQWAEVARATAALAKWQADLAAGKVGLGGDGGAGGEGGEGDTFFGGGAGGAGGNGGDGAIDKSQGGIGGDGGRGGAGGFGAGGGSGGAGGDAGKGGNATGGDAGEGGRGGFGAGEGSNGNGLYGGGGSGFGGAIFVREGGALTLTGNVLFRGNEVVAGSSNNGGEAGETAGTDLFIMKGSTVTLRPGAGNTIRFEGSIADNSKGSYDAASYAAGSGASINIEGPGLVQFAGENGYTGATIIHGGTLEAEDGTGIHANSRVQFDGNGRLGNLSEENVGIWLAEGNITRSVSALETSRLQWNGSGGFAAGDDGLTLNFGSISDNEGPELKWGSGGFAMANHTLAFGSSYGTGAVTLINDVNLNGLIGEIAVFDNQNSDDDHVHFAGNFRNGLLNINDAAYDGTAYFTGQNSLTSLTLNSGKVSTQYGTQIGRLFDADVGGDLILNGGLLEAYGAETIKTLELGQDGAALFLAELTAEEIDNDGILVTVGAVNADNIVNTATGIISALGNLTVAESFTNNGQIALAANVTTDRLEHNGTIALIGNIVEGVETAATRTIIVDEFLGNSNSVILASRPDSSVQNGLILTHSGRSQYHGSIRSGGTVTLNGGGDLWLTGAQRLTGTLNINDATLTMVEGSSLTNFGLGAPPATLAVVVGAGGVYRTDALDNLGSLTNNNSVKITRSINVVGNLTQNAGITEVNGAGRLTVGGITGTGGEIRIANDATFAAYQNGNTIYSGSITGTGTSSTFTKYGTGNLTLNGAADSISISLIDIQGGGLTFDGANILAENVSVNIGEDGRMALLNGDQSISNLTGTGLLALNGNRLQLVNGGNFSGSITGAGSFDFADGEFTLPGDIDADGTVNVGDASHLLPGATPPIVNIGTDNTLGADILNVFGIMNADGTVNADRLNVFNRLNLAGLLNAGSSHIDGGQLHLGNSQTAGQLNSGTTLVNNGGSITGNGYISGTTTVGGASAGYIAPGNSPGVLVYDDLILNNLGTPIIELAGTQGAGLDSDDGGFDQIVADTLTINSGATLRLEQLEGYELALGEKAQIFQVISGKIGGAFSNITSQFDTDLIFNLSTGNVIGLGDYSADGFADALGVTANAKAIVEQLRIETAGGVDQYRGGSLVEFASAALANNGDVAAVFAKASPEGYTGLIDHMKLSMIENLDDMGGYEVAERASVSFTGSVEYAKGKTKQADGYVQSNSQDYRFNLGVMADLPMARLHLSYGRTDGSLGSQNLDMDAKGHQFALGASIPFAMDGGLRLTGRAVFGDYRFDGSRITNAGTAKVKDIKGKANIFGGGLEYYHGGQTTSYSLAGEMLSVSETVHGFSESGVSLAEALNVAELKDDYLLLRAKAEVEHGFSTSLRGFVKLGIDHDVNSDERRITAIAASDVTNFTVRGMGLEKTRFSAAAGSRINLADNILWTLEGHVGNAPSFGASTGLRITF